MAGELPELRRLELSHGALNVARMGSGPPVLLLHQTPRSWDEYRDVIPRLAAAGYTALAFDTPGFGDSAPLSTAPSIPGWAAAAHEALDVLGIERTVVAGHHTGGSIAVEIAANRPTRVAALVLSSTALTDRERRLSPPDESSVDVGEDAETLRRSRADLYPRDRSDLLDRYVADALRAGPLARAGHHAVASYEMEKAIGKLTMPVLLIGATEDPFGYPELARFRATIPHAETAEIAGGMVPLPDGWPEEFASEVIDFLTHRVGFPYSGSNVKKG